MGLLPIIVKPVNKILNWCNMYDMLRDDFVQIMENFDFNKVQSVMQFLDWKWVLNNGNYRVPTVDEIKECVCSLFDNMMEDDRFVSGCCGGFKLSIENENCLKLQFILDEYEIVPELENNDEYCV